MPGEMSAVGTAARNQARMAFKDQGRAEILHRGRERLDAIGQRTVVVIRQAQQDRGDIGAIQRSEQIEFQRTDIGRSRRHQIKTRLRTFILVLSRRRHELPSMSDPMRLQSGGN